MDIVETVAAEIADIPGNPSSLETARVAIEAYQEAIWKPAFGRDSMAPEHRRVRANVLTAHIMQIVGKYICEHDDGRKNMRRAHEELFESLYESGAEVITDQDRAEAGLEPRGPLGLTREQLRIIEAKRTMAMLGPMPPMFATDPAHKP